MTKEEYDLSGNDCYRCKFTLVDNKTEIGIIATFFPDEPDNYYLVKSYHMIDFEKHKEKNDYLLMKSLCNSIDLRDLLKVERI
jgi:hypothetical protein